jgi:hypothetical protein
MPFFSFLDGFEKKGRKKKKENPNLFSFFSFKL